MVLGWLTKSNDPHKQAHCMVCNKDYRAHHKDLEKHNTMGTHIQNMEAINIKQKKITNMCDTNSKDETKIRDINTTVFLACHSSIRSADHFCKILIKDYKCKDLKLHRTKCTSIIKHVIAPNMLKELVDDVGDMPYSLIVDESTNFKNKYLCLCIKYFSINQNRIVTDYLGMIEIENADAITLHSLISAYLEEAHLPIKNLCGLGTDGGSNMCGKNHSLSTLLKADAPNMQLVKCVCHALNLAASAAAEEFPAHVDFLIKETYNWFANSPKRKGEYAQLWETINTVGEDETSKTFHAFVKLSNTRWLARYNAVKVLLEHYFELKTFFDIVIRSEKSYTARQLCHMLNDTSNYLYLRIVKPILYELNDVNLDFQSENVNISCAYDDLINLITLLAKKILRPSCVSQDIENISKALQDDVYILPLEKVEFGIEYKYALLEHRDKIKNEEQCDIESRAVSYIRKLCTQLIQRLPENLKYFRKLKSLSPSVCLSPTRPKFEDLPFLEIFANKNEFGLLENQYNKLSTVNWSDTLNPKQLTDAHKFWAEVFVFKNAGGKFIFRELAKFVLILLSLPSTNAVVERVFSVMNSVRTKFRNRMLLQLLDAILRIKMRFYSNKTCCQSFNASKDMVKDFNARTLYSDKYETEKSKDKPPNDEVGVVELDEVENALSEFDCPCITISEFLL